MKKIKIEKEALEELMHIKEYISKASAFYANKTIKEMLKRIENLKEFPYLGREIEIRSKKVRQIIYKSYKILYKVYSKEVYILHIFHHSRNILNLKI